MRRLMSSRVLGAMVLCAAVPAAAHTEELPTRKAGLWELKMVMAGGQVPAVTMQQCTDESTDKQLTAKFSSTPTASCAKHDLQKTATGYVMDTECGVSGTTLTSHSEITGDFNSAYTIKVSSQRSGGPAAVPQSTSMTVDAKWLGACTADQKAGDIIMPGGMKMNVKDLDNMKGMMKKQ
jgi:uncharacterized protein DUF3617